MIDLGVSPDESPCPPPPQVESIVSDEGEEGPDEASPLQVDPFNFVSE